MRGFLVDYMYNCTLLLGIVLLCDYCCTEPDLLSNLEFVPRSLNVNIVNKTDLIPEKEVSAVLVHRCKVFVNEMDFSETVLLFISC